MRSNSSSVRVLLTAFAIYTIGFLHALHAEQLTVAEFGHLAERCGPSVAPSTLASIARTESDFQTLSINDNTTGKSDVPASRKLATELAAKLIKAGHSVDVGIMQINSANFGSLGLSLDAAFDPCQSIAAASTLLVSNFTGGGDTHVGQQAALRVAISKYNTGDARRGFDNGYVHKVELAAQRIVPALDVGAAPAVIDRLPVRTPNPDPNAPPSWDVWAAFDYDVVHHKDPTAQAANSDAGNGPPVTVSTSGPDRER